MHETAEGGGEIDIVIVSQVEGYFDVWRRRSDKIFVTIIILLNNARAMLVDINQIQTV
jgi:hypothetical protein